MFINYKKHYENFVNEIEWLWNGFFMEESEDTNEIYEGYFDTLSDFYVYYLSKYKVHDQICNIKIINYKKRYLDIVNYINYLYHVAMSDTFLHGPDDKYNNGFLNCARDLLRIIIVISQ